MHDCSVCGCACSAKPRTVEIGQVWKRPNGRFVEVTDERESRGIREVRLLPTGRGRVSWKYDQAVKAEFEFVR